MGISLLFWIQDKPKSFYLIKDEKTTQKINTQVSINKQLLYWAREGPRGYP
jgi:hypothetical protein